MNVKIKILSGFFIIASVALLSGCGCKPQNPKQYSLNLEVWGVLDDRETLNKIFEVYKRDVRGEKDTNPQDEREICEIVKKETGSDFVFIYVPNKKDIEQT